MNKKEYEKLQQMCDFKIKEAQKRYSASPNRADGWKEAFLCMKSILSKQFKPNIVEERPKGEWEYCGIVTSAGHMNYKCSLYPECGSFMADMKGEE